MSNVNNPHGLRPLMRTHSGGNVQTRPYTKAAAYGYAIYKWDPVTLLAGVLNGPASGITPGSTRYVGVALNYSLASLLATMLILDDPGCVFEAQGDGSTGSNVVAAKIPGYNANLLLTTAGGGVTRDNSGAMINEASIAVTSSLDVKLQGLFLAADNAYGAYARVELTFNKHLKNQEVTQT